MNAILNADAYVKEALIKNVLENFDVLAMHPSQFGETEVYKFRVRPFNSDQKENLWDQIDEWSDGTFSESLGVPFLTPEEEGWMDEMGHRSERVEQANCQGPFNEYSKNPPQSAKSYCVHISGCLWSLSCSGNQTRQ